MIDQKIFTARNAECVLQSTEVGDVKQPSVPHTVIG